MAKKPNLWHSRRSVEIQTVKRIHKLACSTCAVVPTERRLLVKEGGGRSQLVIVFCIGCGAAWINERRAEAERAVALLRTGEGYIRLP